MDQASRGPMGLTTARAKQRLGEEGPNALPSSGGRSILAIAGHVVREPMFMLLIGAGSVYLLLGDRMEALVLGASVLLVIAITVIQERRTERALEALRDLSSPRALVLRDGVEQRIAGAEVVRGDLLLLREGDRIAADARLIEAHGLLVDESLITGESVPVAKAAVNEADEEEHSRVFSGTLTVKGTGRAEVTATGPRSELGRIGARLATLDPGKTSLERETSRLVRIFAAVGLALCAVVGTLFIVTRGDLLGGILAGLTLAMAMLPEEFPVVLTVFLALGAWRIGRHNVLTRRMPAVEMLGAATVLCCDKTGTLTENRMTVVEAWAGEDWRPAADWSAAESPLLEYAALACETETFDPMERAILAAAEARAPAVARRRTAWRLERRYPLSEGFLAVCHGWRDENGNAHVAIKGAPETVLPACGLGAGEIERLMALAAQAASRGLRLLAVARAAWAGPQWRASPSDYAFEFLGFVALADPVRSTVPGAVALCRQAGIRVVMITGDHPQTARAIAAAAKLEPGEVLTGNELDRIDDDALDARLKGVTVFARVKPEQKLRLVEAYRRAGEVVAMTGDGVNDAPALKAAHIGVAMGKRGTDVAREAASLVLLDDDFTSIVGTVRLGRRIYENIRNAMRYLLAVHVPTAGMSFLPLLTGWPYFLFPVHIVFLEFVIDPACSIVFEAERSDPRAMERPPRPTGERLFTARSVALGLALGGGVLAGVALAYAGALAAGRSDAQARAIAFSALVFGNLALILANRSRNLTIVEAAMRRNPALWWIVAGTIAALLFVIHVPSAAAIFRFEPVAAFDLALAAIAAFAGVSWWDLAKLRERRRDAGSAR